MKALIGTLISLARYLLLSRIRREGTGVIAHRPSLTTWILQAIPKPKASKIRDFCRLCRETVNKMWMALFVFGHL